MWRTRNTIARVVNDGPLPYNRRRFIEIVERSDAGTQCDTHRYKSRV